MASLSYDFLENLRTFLKGKKMLGLEKLKSKCFQTSYLHPSADVASLISVEIHSHAQLKKSVSLIAEFANNCAQTRLV